MTALAVRGKRTSATASAQHARPDRIARVAPPLALAGTALVLRVGALCAHRHLSLDDGAYGVSVAGMRHGMLPYRDLFSSQGPLHYPLLYAGDLLGLRTRNAPRLTPVMSGIVASIGVWGIARRLGSPPRVTFVAGALVATTGSMLWTTGPVSADGPATALAVCALWSALAYRDAPSRGRALLVGCVFGAALATKPIVFPAAMLIAAWCWRRRRSGDVVVATAAAAVVWLAAAVPWGLSRVWDQSVQFHLDKQRHGSIFGNVDLVATTLLKRDILLVACLALGVMAIHFAHDQARRPDVGIVGAWAGLIVIVLLSEKLLLVDHVVALVPALAILFALRPPPMRWIAVAFAVLAPIQLVQLSGIIVPRGYPPLETEIIAALHTLPPPARVISDIPGLVWQAGRITPRLLNDNSHARIATHRLTVSMVSAAASEPTTCAVVIGSFRFGDLAGLPESLRRDGYVLTIDRGHDSQLWVKRRCDPER